jgi:hypothetical protein
MICARPLRGGARPASPTRSPPAQQKNRQRHGQQPRPVGLGGPALRTGKGHRLRRIDPERHRLRRLPFPLAHEMQIRPGRAAPVDHPRRIAGMGGAVLPELVAQPSTAAAMFAQHHRRGQHLCLGQQRRQGLAQRLGAGTQVGAALRGGGLRHAALPSGRARPAHRPGRNRRSRRARRRRCDAAGAARPRDRQAAAPGFHRYRGGGSAHAAASSPSTRVLTREMMPGQRLAPGARGKGQGHPMRQRRLRQRRHILDRGHQPAHQQRPRPHGQHQRLRGARPRPPGQAVGQFAALGLARAAGAHQIEDRLDHAVAHRHAADHLLRRKQPAGIEDLPALGLFGAGRRDQDLALDTSRAG